MINADFLQLYIGADGGYSLAVSTTTIEFRARTSNRKDKMPRLSTIEKHFWTNMYTNNIL